MTNTPYTPKDYGNEARAKDVLSRINRPKVTPDTPRGYLDGEQAVTDLAGKKLDTSTGVSNPPKSPDQVDALDALQKQIWQAATANKDNPLGYRILDAHFAKLSALLVEAKVSENEFWADIAIDSKPAQHDFQDRIKELEKQREAKT